MEESAKMAETAIVYKNVADGLDTVEESTESIISTMKAFGIEADDTMSIVDRFNEVGNNFAITSAGIGDALQRSASALYEAGNTIDESIGLVTAANSVIQSPEQVGTALKTLSLRIRGVKTELEDAGLETEGMAETTAQLQAKLLALTGGKVDIMLNADEFKSTTQILREMAAVWDDMTDIQRAASLELLGGKRQANILSSLLKNFDIVEQVIETSMNSEGSALIENERHLDSIQGKTELLTNSMQTLWNNTLTSDFLKTLLDIANGFIKLVDNVGLLNVAMAALAAKSAFSKNGILNAIFSATKQYGGVVNAFNGITASATAATLKVNLLNSALTMGASLLIGFAINGIIKLADELITTSEEIEEMASQAESAIESLSSSFKSDEKAVSDYAQRFAELAQGVDLLTGKNVSLTTDDYEEFLNLSNQLANIFPTLSRHYDENGNAIVHLSGDTDTMVGSLYNLLDVQRQITNQKISESLPDLYSGAKLKSDGYLDELNELVQRRESFEKQLNDISSGSFIKNLNYFYKYSTI